MYGALYVVDDLDAYLANPEEYLAAVDLPIRDELLKDRRPRTEWRVEDLAAAVGEMQGGRSYSSARHMFEVASCISCHKIGDAGREFGADLMNLDPPRTAVELLTDVLDPSHKINEKYQSYTFITEGGKVLTGLVLEETPDEVKLIENPLVSTDATVLKVSDIAERRKSPVSLMPKGLLDKLTRDEILDLIAFIVAQGDEQAPIFQGGGHDHHDH
jgi:putative heme-binding domain-containing protein